MLGIRVTVLSRCSWSKDCTYETNLWSVEVKNQWWLSQTWCKSQTGLCSICPQAVMTHCLLAVRQRGRVTPISLMNDEKWKTGWLLWMRLLPTGLLVQEQSWLVAIPFLVVDGLLQNKFHLRRVSSQRLFLTLPSNTECGRLLVQLTIPDIEKLSRSQREVLELHTSLHVHRSLSKGRRVHPDVLRKIERFERTLEAKIWLQDQISITSLYDWPTSPQPQSTMLT